MRIIRATKRVIGATITAASSAFGINGEFCDSAVARKLGVVVIQAVVVVK